MTTQRNAPDFILPIVDEAGRQTPEFNSWVGDITTSLPLLGTGSPEGVVDALQGQLYIDTTGAAGQILYVKRDPNISGDAAKGWVLV